MQLLFGSGELAFQFGYAPVPQLGRLGQVEVALRSLGLTPQRVHLLLDRRDLRDVLLLGAPAVTESGELLALVGELLAQGRQALGTGDVGLLGQRHLFDLEPAYRALDLVNLDRPGIDLHPEAGRGLVHEVDRLVGQEPVGDVPVGQGGRRDQCGVRDADTMVDLVALLQTSKNPNGVRHARLAHQHRLEPSLQGGILFDVLAIFVQCGRADHAQLAPGEHWLEHVAGIHRALALASADDRVQFVEEGDDLTIAVLDLLEDGLEPLLELAAVLRPSHHRAEIQRDDALAAQGLGHITGDDALGQALHNGRLSYTGLADQYGVVLCPAGEHLDHTADLGVAANHGIDLALPGALGEVDAVLAEGLEVLLGIRCGDAPVTAPYRGKGRDKTLLGGARLLERSSDGAADLGEPREHVLGRDVLVAEGAGDLLSRTESVDKLARERRLADARTACAGQVSTARAAARRTSAGLAPTARSSAVAVDPPVSSKASSRCHGSTVACPFFVATATAAAMTSRLFVVRRSAFMRSLCEIDQTVPN